MYIVLKNQPIDKVTDLLVALRGQTENIVRLTGSAQASSRLGVYNAIIAALPEFPDSVEVYKPTWDFYLNDENAGFALSEIPIIINNDPIDSEGNILNINDVVFIYIENFGATKAKVIDITEKGIKLGVSKTREHYVLKSHNYRILKV
jgi:hypothetical protein